MTWQDRLSNSVKSITPSGIRKFFDIAAKMQDVISLGVGELYDGLKTLGLESFEPRGAFYIFPDITSSGLTSEEFAERLIQAEHVALVPGTAFGKCGAGHVRCSYATSIDKISEALNRIEHFLKGHKQ